MLVTNVIYIWINIFLCIGVAKRQSEVKSVVLLVLCIHKIVLVHVDKEMKIRLWVLINGYCSILCKRKSCLFSF